MLSPCGPFHPEASVSTWQNGSSPTRSDIERGNSPEHADLSALGRIQNQDSIVGHQLARTTIEKEQKQHCAIRLISGISSIAVTEFTALYAVEKGADFSGCQDGRLNRHHWTLRQNGSFFVIRLIEKFLEALPAQRDLRIIGSRRHQRVVGRAGVRWLRKEAEKKRGDDEKGKSKGFHFLY